MKKLIAAALIVLSLSNIAMADCDFSKVIHNADGTMTYTKELHICVGQLKEDLDSANTQIVAYKQAIDLKDLAFTKANQNADLWMNTSFKLQDRMNEVDSLKEKNQYLAFGLGILVTGLAVWGAGYLKH